MRRSARVVLGLSLGLILEAGAGWAQGPAEGSPDGGPGPEALAAALAEAVRPTLESALREQARVGFVSFSCAPPPAFAAGARFSCGAVDEDGDRLLYTIEMDENGGATVVRTAQPAAQLPASSRELLETPCLEFLDLYDRRDWAALHAGLHPRFRESDPLENLRDRLVGMRSTFGSVGTISPTLHAVSFEGGNQLEYEVAAERGTLLARFAVAPGEEGGRWLVTAFLLTARPGSPEQALLLRQTGIEVLSRAVGAQVVRVEAPLDRLVKVGDAVEGTAWTGDGRAVPIMVDQHGLRDDFDAKDFRFFVLDAALVARRGLEEQLGGVATVECRDAVVPDGGETTCVATSFADERLEVLLSRAGGEHRLRWRPLSGETTAAVGGE